MKIIAWVVVLIVLGVILTNHKKRKDILIYTDGKDSIYYDMVTRYPWRK